MNAKQFIEQITDACGNDLTREVNVITSQTIDVGGENEVRNEQFTFATRDPIVCSAHPRSINIIIPPQ